MTLDEVKNYKSLQSYKYFISGWVLEVGWKTYYNPGSSTDGADKVVLVLGKVRHSYSANKPPLYPWVIIKHSGAIVLAHCTCMAGLAETCSHVGAILHWVEAAVRVNMSTTCTSKENSWLMPAARENIPFLELNQISFKRNTSSDELLPPSKISHPQPTAIEKEKFFHELSMEQDKIPIVLSVVEPYNASFITSEEHLPPLFSTLYHPVNSEKSHSEVLQLAVDYNIGTTTIDKVN